MNDLTGTVDGAFQSGSTAPTEAGAALRAAREKAGMHVAALAAMLKVPVDKLQALEAGRYQDLPNMTFARALAQSICRVLKVDPKPILQGLPQVAPMRLEPKESDLNAPMPARRPPVFSGGNSTQRSPKAWWLAAAVVVLAGVLWWVLPRRGGAPDDTVAATTAVPASAPAESSAAPAPPELPKDVIAPYESRPGGEAAPAQVAAAPVSAPASAPPTAAAPVQPAASIAPASEKPGVTPAAPAPEGDGVLRLVAHQPTWVQVMAGGKQVLQRTLQAGESVAVPGDGTLSVIVGRADESEVYVRGQRFDLAAYTRNNVARFEVK